MGLLKDGKWVDQWYETKSNQGAFHRENAQMHNWITRDGSPGPTGEAGFKAESGRYIYMFHLPVHGLIEH